MPGLPSEGLAGVPPELRIGRLAGLPELPAEHDGLHLLNQLERALMVAAVVFRAQPDIDCLKQLPPAEQTAAQTQDVGVVVPPRQPGGIGVGTPLNLFAAMLIPTPEPQRSMPRRILPADTAEATRAA